MKAPLGWLWLRALFVFFTLSVSASAAIHFRVATYNLENYLDEPTETRPAKSQESKVKVQESILAMKPDLLCVQEMGSLTALQGLRAELAAKGLDFAFWEFVTGADTNGHIAILSRFPFVERLTRTNDYFLLNGRRFRVSRGFGEVEVQITARYTLTIIAAHLKSKRPVPQANEEDLRIEEAKLLREEIDHRLAANPRLNLIVLGDLNDHKDSTSTKLVIGRGKHKLIDTRPEEHSNSNEADGTEHRNVAWTHFFAKEDSYSRIDFILLSPGAAREWVKAGTQVLVMPGWGVASDHRPLVAEFEAEDK
jgi:endonuclease/exonuclease/phosphatase family metal-dependent hydrolase